MMRALLLLALAGTLVACGSGSSASTGTPTALTVSYWAQGLHAGGKRTWTLRCRPARGTLPRPAAACRRLAAGGPKLFAATPKNVVCTEIYGGPQVARVAGTLDGKRISASFSRTNGCEIDRWNRLSPWLLPRGGAT